VDPLTSDHAGLIATLCENEVELIVVGGTAAVLLGAPLTTLDVDVVYRQTPENVERLHRVLVAIDAEPRPRIPGRKLVPTLSTLESAHGPILLVPRQGPLDLLPRLEPLGNYEALLDKCRSVTVAKHPVLVISLDALILSKQFANRPKDRLALPVLLALKHRQDYRSHPSR
jgi:hypothetical protein